MNKLNDEEYSIVYEDNPGESAWGIIGGGISQFNTQQAGDQNYQQMCFVLKGPNEEITGGMIGATYFDWFYLDLLWVKDDLRRNGYGSRILKCAEDEARKRGAKQAYLDTFSFQAPNFYKQLGYEVFGELSDFPKGHQRYFFKKKLSK